MIEDIYFFEDERGNQPVKEFIDSLDHKKQQKVYAFISILKEHGHSLKRPYCDLLRDGIYELRPHNSRIFYFFYFRNKIVLLHAIKKKTNKIPESDIELSIRRKNKTLRYHRLNKLEL